jgi:ATP-dependent DNA helicase RecG
MIKDLNIILSGGEGYEVDFKRSPGKDLDTEVCAFANASGGRIFIGIDDSGKIVGTDTSNAARSKIQDSINNIEPRPDAVIDVHDRIIVITVHEGKKKPYYCSKGFYLRVGPNSQKLDRDGIIEFLQSEDLVRYDSRVRDEFPIKDRFNEKAYKKYIDKADINDKLSREHVLLNLDCAKRNESGEPVFTNAGALFFRDNTEDVFFDHAKIVCALFKGTGKAKVIDAEEFNGCMLDNIDNAVKFLWKSLRVRHEFEGVQRKNVPEIPDAALREAVTNAVCHRNYFEYGMNVMVEVFDDRVEIYNPGGIPKGLKENEFGTKSVPRNPIIADLLHRAGYIEKMGTGIKKIRDAVADEGLEAPVFTSTMFFTVMFKRPPMHVLSIDKIPGDPSLKLPSDLGENEIKICKLIDENKDITYIGIAERLGMSESTVKRTIRSLVEKRIIIRLGSKRGGSWKVVGEKDLTPK